MSEDERSVDESEGSDDEDLPPLRRSGQVTIDDPAGATGCSYVFDMKLVEDFEYKSMMHIDVDLRHVVGKGGGNPSPVKKSKRADDSGDHGGDVGDSNIVGYLRGNLLPRPCNIFFEMADEHSGELQGLACLFCESDGTASRVKHPNLQEDSPEAVPSGGFLHVETVEVRKQHKGKDLGLRMIHEALVFLNDLWTLAVMEAAPLSIQNLRWKDNDRVGLGCRDVDLHSEYTKEEKKIVQSGCTNLQRHYGRMGFLQAGRKKGVCDAWFLTKESYFDGNVDDAPGAIQRWTTKDRAKQDVDIFVPPPPRELSNLDRDLKAEVTRLFRGARSGNTDLSAIEDLVRRGASIDNSCVMHVAAAKTSGDDVSVLAALVRLGGDVNAADDDGCRPLHVAAALKRPTAIRYLLGSGADRSLTDMGDETALDSFNARLQSTSDMSITFGLDMCPMVREIDVLPNLETAKALMTPQQNESLIEGWLSPRMFKCLTIEAELEVDVFKMKYSEWSDLFNPNQPTPLLEICESGAINRIEYIPLSVLQSDPKGIFQSFHDGYRMIFEAIEKIIKRRNAPTVDRIKQELYSNGQHYDLRKLRHYMDKGGQIEFALDAILKTTENVVTNGDDGWEYGEYEDEIESLPATPLDEMWDVARFMCFNRGGGTLKSRGPHRDVFLFGCNH